MLTIRNIVKKDTHALSKMIQVFAESYDGKLSTLTTSLKQTIQNNKQYYRIVEWNGIPCGYYTLIEIGNPATKQSWWMIRDIYVEPNMRGCGVAKFIRQWAHKHDRIVGTLISYGRVRKNINYFIEQGFSLIGIDPLEQGGLDHNLCVLLYSKVGSYYTQPLSLFAVNQLQSMAYNQWETA